MKTGTKQLGNTTGERIVWLRNYYLISRKDLYDALKKSYPDIAPAYTSIQGWEAGKMPRRSMITMLAKFFKCSEDFLLCKSDNYKLDGTFHLKIKPKELCMYDGEPVLLSIMQEDGNLKECYALVNVRHSCLVFKDRQTLAFNQLSENVEIFAIYPN